MLREMTLPSSQCPQCAHTYDESIHIPKFLPCGHSLCSFCIHYSINVSSIVKCPTCLSLHYPQEFPINMKIVQTLRQIREDEQMLKSNMYNEEPTEKERNLIGYESMQIDTIFEKPRAQTIKKPAHSRMFSQNLHGHMSSACGGYSAASVGKPRIASVAAKQMISTSTAPIGSFISLFEGQKTMNYTTNSLSKITEVNYNLKADDPSKCQNPHCHNKRFVTADNSLAFCGRRCAMLTGAYL
eukprot:TRINITY_DN24210_c0_g1_i1.p1 TRINITY_DN24210_c0_g1~~TRINITY_DN24210_c0_g1_i1.p1  ORF type:complete len:241 (+),score=48.87 TRINITY_DN24210_c0_g1_i1:206-928(+)